MSNFKMGNSKFSRFVNGKGFYIALALCLVAIGTAAYVAVNNSTGILGGIKTGSGASLKSTSSSIPNWDSKNPTKETNKPVSGVAASSKPTSSSSKASSSSQAQNSSTDKLVFTMPVSGSVTTAYSGSKPIFDKTMGDYRVHDGVDIAASLTTPVKACAAGKVIDVKVDDMLGQEVIIDHGNGIKSIYANLTSQVSVKKGQQVDVGDTIGAVGETALGECAVTPHLHFEISKNGKDVDPLATINGK